MVKVVFNIEVVGKVIELVGVIEGGVVVGVLF